MVCISCNVRINTVTALSISIYIAMCIRSSTVGKPPCFGCEMVQLVLSEFEKCVQVCVCVWFRCACACSERLVGVDSRGSGAVCMHGDEVWDTMRVTWPSTGQTIQ